MNHSSACYEIREFSCVLMIGEKNSKNKKDKKKEVENEKFLNIKQQ